MNINNFLKPGNSINVIAAAGTGKTWFIIAKILRLLLEDINPEKITAITFTKKASAEMLDRLNKKVEGWSKQDEKSIKKDLEEIGINKNYDYYIPKAQKLFLKLLYFKPKLCINDGIYAPSKFKFIANLILFAR